MKRLVSKAITLLISFYQVFFSSLKIFITGSPSSCRFHPTCSEYCKECFQRFGLLKAFRLSLRRILSCHPWHDGGYDPVPDISADHLPDVGKCREK